MLSLALHTPEPCRVRKRRAGNMDCPHPILSGIRCDLKLERATAAAVHAGSG